MTRSRTLLIAVFMCQAAADADAAAPPPEIKIGPDPSFSRSEFGNSVAIDRSPQSSSCLQPILVYKDAVQEAS